MRKFAKSILIVVGFLLLAYTLAILGLNIYLQSHGLQSRIREIACTAAGTPVAIQGAYYTPWSGFTISDITLPQTQGRPPVLAAASVNFRIAFFPLLQGRLVLQEVNINSPLLISQNLPDQKSPKPTETPATISPSPQVVTPPLTGGLDITLPSTSNEPQLPAIEVRHINVKNGSFQAYDSKGGLICVLTGSKIEAAMLAGGNLSGKFTITEARVGAFVHPRQIAGTFSWQDGRLSIPDIHGDLSGGTLTGSFELEPGSKFAATVAWNDILVKSLAEDAGISADGAQGSINATSSIRGVPGVPGSITGTAEISMQEARFQPMDIIRQIGDFMNVSELQMLEIKTAEAHLVIRNQQALVEHLVLESENLLMDGVGPVGFDGKMKLRARLHLNTKLREGLSGFLSDHFQDSEREGFRQIPFSITGTISRPKTDLLEKLTGFRIGQDLGGMLKNLFQIPAKKNKTPKSAKETP